MPGKTSRWDTFKGAMKTVGVVGASLAIPAGIAVATGGLGIPVMTAVLPMAKSISDALGGLGLPLPVKALAATLSGCLEGKDGDIVESVFGLVTGKAKEMAHDKKARAQIEEVLRPHMTQINQ
ncbi:hypothetical protein KIPB_008356, partial [Kipferlia bialata]|eukprot:g8356.t1